MKIQLKQQIDFECFKVTKDSYNALHLVTIEPVSDASFLQVLSSIEKVEVEHNKSSDQYAETTAIWVKLQLPKIHLVKQLIQMKYQIHSGLKKQISLCKWISKMKNMIPPFSVFYISCCAVLIKDDCIFLVQQRLGQRRGVYNLPGGRADPNETIKQCVQRQLFQETNIRAKFKYIIDSRESTHMIYNSVDSYVACYLEFEQEALKELKLCQREIQSYKWVPLKDYYQFSLENSTETQVLIAEYITRLWKSGFNFSKDVPNTTKLITKPVGQNGEVKRTCFHQFIQTKL